jgi:hypothetical protein
MAGISFMASAVTSPLRVRVDSGAYSKSCRPNTGGPSLRVTVPERDSDNSPPSAHDTSNVHPRTGYEDPEGDKMCSSTLPLTSALDGGGWSTPRSDRFTPRKEAVPIV